MRKTILLLVLLALSGGAVWAVVHFARAKHATIPVSQNLVSNLPNSLGANAWADAIEKVKADRAGEGSGALEIPQELKHYSDRHWFLATQVAEITKYNIHNCQDYIELAGMIERGELVGVPAVTETYVLFGVGAKADDSEFTKFDGQQTINLYDQAQVKDAYKRIEEQRTKLQTEIQSLKNQAVKLSKRESSKQSQLQTEIVAREQELSSFDQEKQELDKYYGQPDGLQKLMHEYESLQTLAKNFNGRSFDLNNATDRQALKVNMLSSLRPEALKILEAVAATYHTKFDRPLPISSLVRPEQYQHTLRRSNRNAVLIDTPPHSTGLAFDIDYRYMSAGEQTFLMATLAEMKRAGRIEVIRESNSNYHVFVFMNGMRPSDDLITASLDKASEEGQLANHATSSRVPKVSKLKGRATKRNPKSAKPRSSNKSPKKKRR
ncbi:MAG: hypothetical protein C5B55_07015 [Blastocatellia bacterium]|nr:MAG: hypothetical protein C5B55_07015 [Blastocatellia bacterium]